MSGIKRIGRELVYNGTVVDFYKDTMELPDGKVEYFDFIKHKGAAAVVAVKDNGKLLMVRQYRNALDRDTLEIPAGGKNGIDEPTRICAARELEEETGYKSENLELLLQMYTTVAFCNEKIDIYVAKDLIPSKQNLDDDEFVDVEEWDIDDWCKLIYEGKIQDAKTMAALLAYKLKYCK